MNQPTWYSTCSLWVIFRIFIPCWKCCFKKGIFIIQTQLAFTRTFKINLCWCESTWCFVLSDSIVYSTCTFKLLWGGAFLSSFFNRNIRFLPVLSEWDYHFSRHLKKFQSTWYVTCGMFASVVFSTQNLSSGNANHFPNLLKCRDFHCSKMLSLPVMDRTWQK